MDDFELNVAVNDAAPVQKKVKVQGGRWTDRVKAKRKVEFDRRKASKQAPQQSTAAPDQPLTARDSLKDSPTTQKKAYRPPASESKRGFISSLFTAEGLPEAPKDAPVVLPSQPSNAPLAPQPSSSKTTLDDLQDEEQEDVDEEEEEDPCPALSDLGLVRPVVKQLVNKLGINAPTLCQSIGIPEILKLDSTQSDLMLRAQTGSGKTLTFLLPMLQDLLSLQNASPKVDRSIGTLALILAPTRELAAQIYDVLSSLLSMPHHSSFKISPRALTPVLLVGGANRTHEKRRLRKGAPIVIATPGRLLDHLKTTEAFRMAGQPAKSLAPKGKNNANNVPLGSSKSLGLRWLVVDECDRLMDLGFEEQMKGILEEVTSRSLAPRKTVLCSATATEGVERLSGLLTKGEPKLVSVGESKLSNGSPSKASNGYESFSAPAQLVHQFVVVPPKLRFVSLVAHLRKTFSASAVQKNGPHKTLVFVSCTDAVDFYFIALGSLKMGSSSLEKKDEDDEEHPSAKDKAKKEQDAALDRKTRIVSRTKLLPGLGVYRLHGNMDLAMRNASLKAFKEDKNERGNVLICTSVAARGIDIAGVSEVICYDAATEGGISEYVHRVGRTARAGAQGSALSFLLPSERGWVDWAQQGLKNGAPKPPRFAEIGIEDCLRKGYGGEGREYETRATDVQMGFERWVQSDPAHEQMARTAFKAHVAAYATHPSAEKQMFNVKALHLGHLAKSFGMREAPSQAGHGSSSGGSKRKRDDAADFKSKRAKMDKVVKRLTGKQGQASEFQVADTSMLDSLTKRKS